MGITHLPVNRVQGSVGPDDDVRAEHHKIRSDCRILYIEDNPASARFVERGFKKLHKVEVKVADNGYRGLDMAAREKPEVILLDMELPDIHGMEVLKKLRAIPELARARIYGVSADALSYTGGDIQDAGLDGYLTKPFDLSVSGYKLALKIWHDVIEKRDIVCQMCGGNQKLEAHHLLYRANYPLLSFNENNGILLCRMCHYHTHGKKLISTE
mgnify:CR=1 FL=1